MRPSPPWLWGAIAGAPLLLALFPLLVAAWPAWLLAVFLQQPCYMLHQIEEHRGDRFRAWVTARIGHGREVLSPAAIRLINVGGVWAVNALALLLAGVAHPGFGLLAVYLTLVNALGHILGGLVLRSYNPGLTTAVALFLPVGSAGWALVAAQPGVGLVAHGLALAGAVGLHAAIALHVRGRVEALPHAA